jgi:hypothetical protein
VLIALLAVLGVDLIVIVLLLGAMLTRRRWVSHQPGSFKGAIRVVRGDVPGLSAKWKRGYARWVSEVLVWTKSPFLFRNELVVVTGPAGELRTAGPDVVKRLGADPVIVPLQVDVGTRVEIAASNESRAMAAGPFAGGAARSVTE